MFKKIVVLCLSLLFLASAPVAADDNKPSKADLIEMFKLSNFDQTLQQMTTITVKSIIQLLKNNDKRHDQVLPERNYQVLEKGVYDFILKKTYVSGGLIDQIIPIYQKYWTKEDVQLQIKYLKTPSAQRIMRTTPMIMQESFLKGQMYFKSLVPEIQELAKEIVKELKSQ
ncbi:DUF2059 domain-containing protein [Dethiosulfatarculus sandiegensis]|uniref:DUF2059 domain-containing protein n=1 Tax=Dethiosulfatarculus sandiegensis TaxID=1429043 RepID=A0A0D2JCG8_9BACT|nr:DUF2059 domain-containing protein [Dethiosulfatarculus sandiegensis]KIX13446.1 hypothetical protein X474_13255 [Dethiosulfatarculus sandiegensis]